MIKRPLCAAALAWAAALWLLGRTGLPFFSFSPPVLPKGADREEAEISGIVYQKENYSYSANFYIKKARLILNSKQYPIDCIKVHISKTDFQEEILEGDLIQVRGKLEDIPEPGNPGQFHERNYYYARQVKWFQEGEAVRVLQRRRDWSLAFQGRIKEKLREGIAVSFSEKNRGILEAMLLGDRGNIEREDKLLFQMMGISHILAISGLHLSVLGWGLFKVLRKLRFSLKAAGALAGVCMVFYGEMTGGGASVMRAVVMFGTALGALAFRRTYDMLSALALSAVLLLGGNPLYLYDSSFLLSFGAVLGLGAVFPVLFPRKKRKKGEKKRERWLRIILENLRASLSVWSIILPLVMRFFYEIPLWGLAANLLVFPTVEILLLSGLAGGALGLLPFPISFLGKGAGAAGELVLGIYKAAGELIQAAPWAIWITGRPGTASCAGYYLFFLVFLVLRERGKKKGQKGPGWISLGALGAGILLLLYRNPIEGVRLCFLDVGQGDCACIQTTGSCYLVDGGSSDIQRAGTYRILPFLKSQGISRVDGVFISHMDQDHVNGMIELLELVKKRETGLKIERLFLSYCGETEEELLELEKLGREAGSRIFYLEKGDRLTEEELEIECLAPETEDLESNAGSQVLLVKRGDFRALFTGDIEGEGEKRLIEYLEQAGEKCTVLKTAHHGSKNSTPEELLDLIRPEAAVVSSGEDNPYGHPHRELLDRMEDRGIPVFKTQEQGAIFIRNSGEYTEASFQRRGIMVE